MMKVLVALDGSSRSRDVLRAGIALGRRNDATLVLLRCVGMPAEIPLEALTAAPDDVPMLLQARAMRELEVLKAGVPPELTASLRVVVANPWEGIERVAREEDVALIVIGSHGYGRLDRVLGTTAAKVVNHAARSVLVVRDVDRLLAE
jgi:nucleotide-binding universal stress UspA family protein